MKVDEIAKRLKVNEWIKGEEWGKYFYQFTPYSPLLLGLIIRELLPRENSILLLGNEVEELNDAVMCWNEKKIIKIQQRDKGMESLTESEKIEMMEGLRWLMEGRGGVIITNWVEGLPFKRELEEKSVEIKVGEEVGFSELIGRLVNIGLNRVRRVEGIGELAVRGGIIDLWGYGLTFPLRVEFREDKVVSLRKFDPFSQLSIQRVVRCKLLPMNIKEFRSTIFDYVGESIVIIEPTFYIKNPPFFFKDINLPIEVIVPPRRMEEIKNSLKEYEVFFFYETEIQKERMKELLSFFSPHLVKVKRMPRRGVILSSIKVALLTYFDLFGYKARAPRRYFFKNKSVPIESIGALKEGEVVVHIQHGIGIYKGIKPQKIRNSITDCLLIEYKDGDFLYVPVEDFHLVEKWVSPKKAPPPLTSLDSFVWERRKKKTRKEVEEMAKKLLTLYAERKISKGYQFSPDTVWQHDLESTFPYEETEDQLKAIEEVKRDMEKPFPMERLICGEVGYGKTEIALRAAFKAVMDGKQVVILAPTTILVEQHLRRFKERLQKFPIIVEKLCRFQRKKEREEIIEKLEKGKIDIIIGTHMLLSPRVKFRSLGLLIIDEEHKFGVVHKEQLRTITKNLDTLYLTATPIPRTLYKVMSHLQDISKLQTPPYGRKSIFTKIIFWDDYLIEELILKELMRGGQVYFVHNRIEDIEEIAQKLQTLNPKFKIGIAHSRLKNVQLEEIMLRFLDQEFNILVTTTIIGSGIDISNVNTIFVNNASHFGLSELHQLRGRVGRGDRRAYCYLLINEKLPTQAQRRLQAIVTHTELGAGFKLAMEDMEMRGVGNLLGKEQHGYIHGVGYHLYMKLLEQETARLKGEIVEEERKVEIKLGKNAYIPEWYIPEEEKIEWYKRLAGIKSIEEVEEVEKELTDRFSSPPQEVKNLLNRVKLKIVSQKLGITEIVHLKEGITIKKKEKTTLLPHYSEDQLLNFLLTSFKN